MEVSEVRRRLRGAIERAREQAAARRERSDAAARAYETFLQERAVPMFRMFANALSAEGHHHFEVFTPTDSVRLASQKSPADYIELLLDTDADPPQVIGRSSRGRGRRSVTDERPLRRGTAVSDLTDEDVLAFLAEEILPFVER
jgi:hypothetical protein